MDKEYVNSKEKQSIKFIDKYGCWTYIINYNTINKIHRIGGPAMFDKFFNLYFWYVNNKPVEIYYICG